MSRSAAMSASAAARRCNSAAASARRCSASSSARVVLSETSCSDCSTLIVVLCSTCHRLQLQRCLFRPSCQRASLIPEEEKSLHLSSQLRADQMPGSPREGQLMYTLFLSRRQRPVRTLSRASGRAGKQARGVWATYRCGPLLAGARWLAQLAKLHGLQAGTHGLDLPGGSRIVPHCIPQLILHLHMQRHLGVAIRWVSCHLESGVCSSTFL